jgi:hypothetical protein
MNCNEGDPDSVGGWDGGLSSIARPSRLVAATLTEDYKGWSFPTSDQRVGRTVNDRVDGFRSGTRMIIFPPARKQQCALTNGWPGRFIWGPKRTAPPVVNMAQTLACWPEGRRRRFCRIRRKTFRGNQGFSLTQQAPAHGRGKTMHERGYKTAAGET